MLARAATAATLVRCAVRSAPVVRVAARSAAAAPARGVAGIAVEFEGARQPRTSDKEVSVTFVNYAGERCTVTGRVGQTLTELANEAKYEYLDDACGGGGGKFAIKHNEVWTEDQYGEGASCYHCKVVLPSSFAHVLPDMLADEAQRLEDYPERIGGASRLACQVTLSPAMNGMVVHVPDTGVSEIP